MITPENGRAATPGEPDGDRFLADIDAALQGHEPDGSQADTARFAAQLAGVLQSQAGSAPENLRQKVNDSPVAKPAEKDRKPSTVVRMDRALNRFRIGVLDLAAIVALTVLGILIWRSLQNDTVAKPDLKPAEPEKRLAAEDAKPPAPDAAPPKVQPEEPWEREIRAKLERKVSFDFVDTPLDEVLGFLRSLSNINIVLDPKAAATGANKTPITLRVQDMTLGVAFQWILRVSDLRMSLRDQCLFVSSSDATLVEMRVFDVSGLPISAELLASLLGQKFPVPVFEKSDISIAAIGNLLQVAHSREALREIRGMITTIREQAPTGKIVFQSDAVPEWKKAVQGKLKKKVTFEFVDTPLEEAIAFLQNLANVNIVVDPKIIAAGSPTINLRVTDMELSLAMEWILRLADCNYSIENEAVFISKAGIKRPVLIGYDIKSILKDRDMTPDTLQNAVKSTVAPNSWDSPSPSIRVNNTDTWMFVQHDETVQQQVESLLQKIANPEKP